MNYIAKRTEHVVVKGDKWQLIDLPYGANLSTSKPFDVYTDRQEAIDAIKAHDPAFEPSEWTPTPPPESVSMRQARLALLQAGHLDQVDDAIHAIADPMQRRAAEIEWDHAATVDRDSPLTQAIAAEVGMSEDEIDQLFWVAANL